MTYHLRRTDRQITDEAAIERILKQGRFTTIALTGADGPYAVTLSYGYDADASRLYFHVAHEGRKLAMIAEDSRACATIVLDHGYTTGECEHPFESVVMFGRMRIVTDADEKLRAIRTLVNHLEAEPQGYWDSRSWQIEDRIGGFTALAFEIDELTAKQGK